MAVIAGGTDAVVRFVPVVGGVALVTEVHQDRVWFPRGAPRGDPAVSAVCHPARGTDLNMLAEADGLAVRVAVGRG